MLPYLQEVMPKGRHIMQDNDAKHTSWNISDFLEAESIN